MIGFIIGFTWLTLAVNTALAAWEIANGKPWVFSVFLAVVNIVTLRILRTVQRWEQEAKRGSK